MMTTLDRCTVAETRDILADQRAEIGIRRLHA
jgi:hypothetical protein